MKPKRLSFALTSKCNLRCSYCTQGVYNGVEMHPDLVEKIVSYIIDNEIKDVNLSFFGETTTVKNWWVPINRILDSGAKISTASNLAKRLTDDEIDCYSRFDSIQVSLDTVDKDILARIRKAVNLDVILQNMHNIREHATKKNRRVPEIEWICVLTEPVVWTLSDWVQAAHDNGVPKVGINEMAHFDEAYDHEVGSIFNLQKDDFVLAVNSVTKAKVLAHQLGLRFAITPSSFWEIAERRINEDDQFDISPWYRRVRFPQGVGWFLSNAKFKTLAPAQTRLCTKPWDELFISAEGNLHTCCVRGEVMAQLHPGSNIKDAHNSYDYMRLRKKFLTGDLGGDTCENCPLDQPIVNIGTMLNIICD